MSPNRETLCYLAGYFDGEGCITVDSGLRLLVSATYPTGCLRLREAFGGKVVRRKSKPGTKAIYQWTVYGDAAHKALLALKPFLCEKRTQAFYAIVWFENAEPLWRETFSGIIKSDKHVSWNLPPRANVAPTVLTDPELYDAAES